DQVRIPTVGEDCVRGSRRDDEVGSLPGQSEDVIHHGLELVPLDVFENVRAGNHVNGLRQDALLRYPRIVFVDAEALPGEGLRKLPLAAAVVENRPRADLSRIAPHGLGVLPPVGAPIRLLVEATYLF